MKVLTLSKIYREVSILDRNNIGLSVVKCKGEVVYAANITTRNHEIPKLMAKRAQHCRASRSRQRLVRKRKAQRNNTLTEFSDGRKLPGFKDGKLAVKDIINQESRFNNRKHPARWLTTTATVVGSTHLNMIKQIIKFMPITNWTIEYNKFAFMQIEAGSVQGVDYQNGKLKNYASVKDYICVMQEGRCALCGKPMDKNNDKHFEIHQFRRHNRERIRSQTERTYKYERKIVAKNRKALCEQKGASLSQWRENIAKQYGEA